MAQLDGTPMDELTIARWIRWKVRPDEESDPTIATKSWGSALRKRNKNKEHTSNDEEKASQDSSSSESRLSTVSEYRDISSSVWLHFPHVELVFLLFAFEGATAAGASALRESRCPGVIVAAAAMLVRLLE